MPAKVTLTIKNGRFAGQKYQFREPRSYTIGRGSDCDVTLPKCYEFLAVSRRHCILDVAPPKIQVRDNGSRNGTQLNGMQIGRPADWRLDEEQRASPPYVYELRNGDELDVGGVRFDVKIGEATH